MMDTLIQAFPAQLIEALQIGQNASIRMPEAKITHVYIAGMGGSGIGANFVSEFIKKECKIPYLIGNGYDIPSYINENTLFIASSYSGNTEETLSALELAAQTGAKVICLASGGKLIDKAISKGWDYIQLPSGSPSPRACLGYSMVQQLCILNKLGFISNKLLGNVKSASDLINYDQAEIMNKAEKVAQILFGKMPVIYTTDRMEAVAVRLRQQLNENAKILCWHHVIPEMNHNELVGWKDTYPNMAVLYFRNRDDYYKNGLRIDINKEIIGSKCSTIVEIYSKGQSLIEKSIYFIHLGDWISWYLSKSRKVDAIEIDVIDYLKSELAKD